jgi:hypothetical protein
MHVTAKLLKIVALVALVALTTACGEFTRDGRAPVIMVVDRLSVDDDQGTLLSDVITDGSTFNDMAVVEMHLIVKDPGAAGAPSTPSLLNTVTITRYRVEYRRADGRNVPGQDVPFPFDSALTLTIPSDGTESAAFQLVRHSAKEEAPLKALAVNNEIISTIASVTFYGRDQAGNEVSATASVGIDFGNFADPD